MFYGFTCNINEKKNFDFYKMHCISDRLAKVYFCFPFGLFLIMEKVTTLDNFKPKHADWVIKNVFCKELILYNGNKDQVLSIDGARRNFGFRGRKVVLLDYA